MTKLNFQILISMRLIPRVKALIIVGVGFAHYVATSNFEATEKAQNKFDLIINTVSSAADMNTYLGMLKRDGTMVLVGAPSDELPIQAFSIIQQRKSLSSSTIGGIRETQEMLDFCGKHDITSDIEVIPIHVINDAYELILKTLPAMRCCKMFNRTEFSLTLLTSSVAFSVW